jgi:hypothetical protein
MGVGANVIGRETPVQRARGDDRYLHLERDKGLQDGRRSTERRPGPGRSVTRLDPDLPLAVIPEAAGLQDGGRPEFGERARQVGLTVDGPERGGLDAEFGHEGLFGQPILGRCERQGIGIERPQGRDDLGRPAGHILELVGDDVDGSGERVERCLVIVVGNRSAQRDVEGGTIGIRREDVRAQPEPGRRHRDHAPQLTAAQMPSVLPGVIGGLCSALVNGTLRHGAGLRGPPRIEPDGERRVAQGQNGCGQKRRVHGAGPADRERPNRDAGRHLNDREKAVLAGQSP